MSGRKWTPLYHDWPYSYTNQRYVSAPSCSFAGHPISVSCWARMLTSQAIIERGATWGEGCLTLCYLLGRWTHCIPVEANSHPHPSSSDFPLHACAQIFYFVWHTSEKNFVSVLSAQSVCLKYNSTLNANIYSLMHTCRANRLPHARAPAVNNKINKMYIYISKKKNP